MTSLNYFKGPHSWIKDWVGDRVGRASAEVGKAGKEAVAMTQVNDGCLPPGEIGEKYLYARYHFEGRASSLDIDVREWG